MLALTDTGFENSLARDKECKQIIMARNRKKPTESGVVTFFIFWNECS